LIIQGPYFDADEHLKSYGLKFYWSDWPGHPCHLTIWALEEIGIGLGFTDCVMMGNGKIVESSD
jgi:hypothetical protein